MQSSLKKEENFTSNLLNMYKSSTDEIQKKRIFAVEQLWENTMVIKEKTSGLLFYSILTDSEFQDPKQKDFIQKCVDGLPKLEEMNEILINVRKNENHLRLFVNDTTWKIYSVYVLFLARLVFNVHLSTIKKKEIPHWKSDDVVKKQLKLVINEEELEKIYALSHGSYKFIFTYLEELMLIALQKEFSGEFQLRDQKDLFKKINDDITSESITLKDLTNRYEFQKIWSGFW